MPTVSIVMFFVGMPHNSSFYHPGPIGGADEWYTVVSLLL